MSERIKNMTDWGALGDMLDEQDEGKKIDEEKMRAALTGRVRGQDHVIDDLIKLIKVQWAKKERKRPIANLLFLGPTGTGKTELAKALAEYLFEDESNMVRFDCSEFTGPESKTRLIGVPTGYVGSQSGGQLTRAVIQKKERLILFDEIEKAYRDVFDLFLQMMGEGRLTEQGSGKTADFTKSIIILTSNAESDAISQIQEQVKDYHEMVNAVKSHLADTQIFRPEIVGRINRVYVFKPLGGMITAEIAALKLVGLGKEYGLEVEYVAPALLFDVLKKSEKVSRFGVRAMEEVIHEEFAEAMVAAKDAGLERVRLELGDDGVLEMNPSEDEPTE